MIIWVFALSISSFALADSSDLIKVVTQANGVFDEVRKLRSPKNCSGSGLLFEDSDTYTAYIKHERSFRTSIPLTEARRLFAEFRARDDLPFQNPINGCQARATVMARDLEARGIYSRKIYAAGALEAKNACSPDGVVRWNEHVSPLVTVEMPDGTRVDMAFDPSLTVEPVPASQWLGLMAKRCKPLPIAAIDSRKANDPACAYIITSRFVSSFPASAAYLKSFRPAWDEWDLSTMRGALKSAKENEALCAEPAPKDAR
jgi:hypothetical protein